MDQRPPWERDEDDDDVDFRPEPPARPASGDPTARPTSGDPTEGVRIIGADEAS